MKRKLFLNSIILLLFFTIVEKVAGQVDKEFWFVAPEVSRHHGDLPVVFRLTTFDEKANITISIPANPSFTPIIAEIDPNTQWSYEITSRSLLDLFENRPANQVNNKGVLIKSDVDISVYYEVASSVNPDKFTLKGRNALGTEFFVPSQNHFSNRGYSPDKAKERVDIVATEDNTIVTITVSDDVEGHAKGSTFSVSLNKGQTYCLQSRSRSASRHLGGTHIISNRPIAVTISDDSIMEPGGGCWDLIGDQLIPVTLIGNEYIAINTLYGMGISNSTQKVYIVSTSDNTFIEIDGNPKGPFNRGEMTSFDISSNAIHILANHPIYAYQVSGLPHKGTNPPKGNELGSALLPHIACTGSRKVSFTRTLNERFFIQLLVQGKNRNSFIMRNHEDVNVTNDHLKDLNWVKVEGSNNGNADDAWYTAVKQLKITTGSPYSIENNAGLFHLSILDENKGSMSYGYFSAYSTIRIKGPSIECKGNEVTLSTNEDMKSYLWYSDKDINTPISNEPSIIITESGKYWVQAEVNFGGCYTSDALEVNFKMPEFSLGEDVIVCPGETVSYLIEGFDENEEFLWTPGNITTNEFSITPAAGETIDVTLTITDELGCSNSETVSVIGYEAALIEWDLSGNDICIGDTIWNTTAMAGYEWSFEGVVLNVDDDQQDFIVPHESGSYSLTVWTDNDCLGTYSRDIMVRPLPEPVLNEVWACPGEQATISLDGFNSYLWYDGSTSSQITLDQPEEDIWVEVTNEFGCTVKESTHFSWFNQEAFSFGSDTSVCIGADILIEIDEDFYDYSWIFDNDQVSNLHYYEINSAHPALHEGYYSISARDENGCNLSHEFYLEVQTVPELELIDKTNICRGDTIVIATPNHSFVRYEWELTDIHGNKEYYGDEYYALVSEEGTYSLRAWQANECSNYDEIEVKVIDQPIFDIATSADGICPGDEFSAELIDWEPGAAGDTSPSRYQWRLMDEEQTIGYSIKSEDTQFTSNIPGDYMLVAFDSNNCFSAFPFAVEGYIPQEIELEDDSFCDNSDFTLKLPNDLNGLVTSYQWVHLDTSKSGDQDASWVVNEEGTYALNITDPNGCKNSASMELHHLPSPIFSLGKDRELCYGDYLEIIVQDDFTRYEWNNDTSDDQSPYLKVSDSGDYQLRVWNEFACSSYEEVNITINDLPTVSLGDDLILCAGERTTLTVSNFENIYWSTGALNVNSVIANTGVYSVRVVDEKGCSNSDTVTIEWRPVPDVDLGSDLIICPVDYPISISAPEGFEAYEWHNGSSSRSIFANLLDTVNLVRVQDEFGCWGWDTKVVKFHNQPNYSASGDVEVCEPEEAILDAGEFFYSSYHSDENYSFLQSYLWSNGSTEQTIKVVESGDFWVEVSDGCFVLRDTMRVDYHPSPVIIGLDTIFYAQVTALVESGTSPYRYALNDNEFQDSPTFINVKNGEHILWVEDINNCETFTTFTLNSNLDLQIPNVFTPNGDGINDTWEIKGIEKVPGSIISIYDRHGKLLVKFEATDPPWDGRYMNRPLPSDDYWYVIYVKPIEKIIRGNITIMR